MLRRVASARHADVCVAHLALVAEEGARMTMAEALRVAKRRPGASGGSATGTRPPRCAVSPAQRPASRIPRFVHGHMTLGAVQDVLALSTLAGFDGQGPADHPRGQNSLAAGGCVVLSSSLPTAEHSEGPQHPPPLPPQPLEEPSQEADSGAPGAGGECSACDRPPAARGRDSSRASENLPESA